MKNLTEVEIKAIKKDHELVFDDADAFDALCDMALESLKAPAVTTAPAPLSSEAVGQLLEDMTITFRTLAKGKHPDGLRIDMDWLRSISKNYVERSTVPLTPSPSEKP